MNNSGSPDLSNTVKNFNNELKKRNGKPLYELTQQEARLFLINLQNETHREIDADIEDRAIYTTDCGSIDLRIVRPKNSGKNILPAMLYLHGGGWVMGGKSTHDMLIRTLANEIGVTVIFPEYTLSPEARFPVPLKQCYSVLEYLYENPEEFNIDKEKIVIAGDSAGGNMAASAALMSKYSAGPSILLQVLLYPVTDLNPDTKSYNEFKDGPWLTKKAMQWFIDAYAPDKTARNDIYASPLKAPVEKLANLPPALIITAENDVLRDEGEMYASKLQKAGTDVLSLRINGTQHDFLMLNALQNTMQFRSAVAVIKQAVSDVLEN